MTIDDAVLGENVHVARTAKGFTQSALADAVGIDRSALSRIEKGSRSLTVVETAQIADALGVDVAQLIRSGQPAVLADQARVVVENVRPEIDGGVFPAKGVVGETFLVEADVFADGHDTLAGVLQYRRADEANWQEVRLTPLFNDRWQASFPLSEMGRYVYTIEAWVDHFASWRRDLEKRVAARQDVSTDLLIGADLIRAAAGRARGSARATLLRDADSIASGEQRAAIDRALDPRVAERVGRFPDRSDSSTYGRLLSVVVDPERARTGAWYEMFPRSTAALPGKHGTLDDCIKRLPYIAEMGFDVLYLPPIHPIGESHRKGPNNAERAAPGDPGSPWAIGSPAGGHKAVNPDLGTLDDFRRLVAAAKELSIEIAMDIAFQCSPDHPYVKEHPSWFRWRPDGTVQYAENPPKKYQDIFPINFDTEDWQALWNELRDVFLFWLEHGVRIFRVDNPHTKPLRFWAWLIDEIKRDYPDAVFLAEAFTRPRIMYNLAKAGFSQSYTYFAWRNSAWELREYFTELTRTEVKDFFRPNLWPNTPDILTEYLQFGGPPAFMSRLVLAATLGASYGIYGPPFELCLGLAREPGSEEYRDSEKYEVRHWDLDQPHSLRHIIARMNQIRRSNPALQTNDGLVFHGVDNDQIVCFSKSTPQMDNVVLTLVNLDPYHIQSGWVNLDLERLGLRHDETFQVHDLLSEARFLWSGGRNYVELNPRTLPAHVFLMRRRVLRESDFDYYQ